MKNFFYLMSFKSVDDADAWARRSRRVSGMTSPDGDVYVHIPNTLRVAEQAGHIFMDDHDTFSGELSRVIDHELVHSFYRDIQDERYMSALEQFYEEKMAEAFEDAGAWAR